MAAPGPRRDGWAGVLRRLRRGAVAVRQLHADAVGGNWFFGAGYLDFSTPARSALARYEFFYREPDAAQFWRGIAVTAIAEVRPLRNSLIMKD